MTDTRAYKYITKYTSPNQNSRNSKIEGITIHWWGKPVGQSIEDVVSWLCNKRAGTSAHYVVSDGVVYCIVDPDKRAWHAGNSKANHTQIGLELDPNPSKRAGTMKTAAALIKDLRSTYGNLPLSPHKRWTSTECPGNYDLVALDKLARGTTSSKPSKPSKPSTPSKTSTSKKKLVVDGRFGTSTVKALQSFLNTKGAKMAVDGRAGKATWKALQTFLKAPIVDGQISHQSYKASELGNGISQGWKYTGRNSKGSKTVVALQKWLGVKADGVWYESTTKALQNKLNSL